MSFRPIAVCLLLGFVFCQGYFTEAAVAAPPKGIAFTWSERRYLLRQFSDGGYSYRFLAKVFLNKKLQKIPSIVRQNIVNKVPKNSYDDFVSSYSIDRAVRFSRKWRTLLSKASRKFQVEKEVIVAILLVETGLGTIRGDYHVASVFSSIIAENYAKVRELRSKPTLGKRERYELNRLNSKDRWARKEMAALLKIIKKTRHDPFHFKGSYAGAFGISQFLPSSYLEWGFDADNNGSVNLYWFPDAIYSVGNYLKAHGWKFGLTEKRKEKIIWKYNHSKRYVDTVLLAARKIGQKRRGEKSD